MEMEVFLSCPQNVSSLVFTGITQERTHEAGGLDQSAAHKLGDDLSSLPPDSVHLFLGTV